MLSETDTYTYIGPVVMSNGIAFRNNRSGMVFVAPDDMVLEWSQRGQLILG